MLSFLYIYKYIYVYICIESAYPIFCEVLAPTIPIPKNP